MQKLFLIGGIAILAAVGVLVLWAVNAPRDSVPVGWLVHENETLGFRIAYPDSLDIVTRQEDSSPLFTEVRDPQELGADLEPPEEFWLRVQRLPMERGASLEQVAQARSQRVEPVTVRALQGYRYVEENDIEGAIWTLLVPASEGEFFEISYSVTDPTNQEYEQIAQQMLASFEGEQGISPLAILIGIILVLGTLTSGGLLLITRRA